MKEKNIDDYREMLDVIDKQLIRIIGERFAVCREVAKYKKKHRIPMMQHARVAEVKATRKQIGRENNLRNEFVNKLYALIIQEACDLEDEIIDS